MPNNQEILSWLAQARASGLSDIQIRQQLRSTGWQDDHITKLLGPTVLQEPKRDLPQMSEPGIATDIESQLSRTIQGGKPRIKIWPIAVVAFAVFLISGTAFAAWKGYVSVPILSPYINALQLKGIEKAFQNMYNLKGAEVGLDFAFASEPRAANAKPFPSDPSDKTTEEALSMLPKDMKLAMHLTVFANSANNQAAVQDVKDLEALMSANMSYEASGIALSGKAEIRMKDGKMYVRVPEFPDVGLFDASSFIGKWFWLDMKKAMENNPLTNTALQNTNSSTPSAWDKEIPSMYRIARDTKFISTESLGNEKVNGKNAKKYALKVDAAKLTDFVDQYRKDMQKRNVSIKEISDALTEMVKKENVDSLKQMQDAATLFVWVTPDEYITKGSLEVVIVPPDTQASLKDVQYRLMIGISFDKFNQKPVVEAPANATSLEELFGNIFAPISFSSNDDGERKNDLRMLKTALALYYDDHTTYPETVDELAPNYIAVMPTDPKSGGRYMYDKTGQGYEICATLDNGSPFCITMSNGVVSETPANITDTDTASASDDAKIQQQAEVIYAIGNALDAYHTENATYPGTLDALLKSPVTAIDQPSSTKSYFSADDAGIINDKIPNDIFTNQPFGYVKEGDSYRLTYTMRVGANNFMNSNMDFLGMVKAQFVDGINTATPENMSVEAVNNPDYGKLKEARINARDADRKSDLAQLRTGMALFYDDNNGFPYTTTVGQPDQSNDSNKSGAVGKIFIKTGPLIEEYLAQELLGLTAKGKAYDRYYYLDDHIIPGELSKHYVLYTMLEGDEGKYYYAINDEGKVWDVGDKKTEAPSCIAGRVRICGYAD